MQRLLNRIAYGLAAFASLFLAAMMVVTVVDVILRDVFNTGIQGTLEIIELLLACTFFIALPALFVKDAHIVVDAVDTVAPRWVPRLRRLATLLATVTLAAMGCRGGSPPRTRSSSVTSPLTCRSRASGTGCPSSSA